MTDQYVRDILAQYPIEDIVSIDPIPLSLINQNFFVATKDGNYILQRLAKIFTRDTVEDMAKVTAHLAKKQIATLTLIPTKRSDWCYEDDEKFLWKLMVAVPGETFHVIPSPEYAYEAGRLLGTFQEGLKDFDPEELHNPLRLHETAKINADYQAVHARLMKEATEQQDKDAYDYIAKELPSSMLPDDLPRSVVHGDPKISNIIFHNSRGICMIDLDTTILHTPLVDIGDALRSWCGREEDLPDNAFSLDIFKEAVRGYLSVMSLSDRERKLIYQATRMITLELAARFATDIVNDNYFGWDSTRYASRKEHNRMRAYSMVQLARDMASKEQEMQRIILTKKR